MDSSRWVLGFDAACSQCTELARRAEAVSGGKLTALSLHEPEVRDWTDAAGAGSGRFEPTLFRVQGEAVQAWTGRRLALRLVVLLGPRRAWKILASIVELRLARQAGFDAGRRRLLKLTGSTALALVMLGPKALRPLTAAAETATWASLDLGTPAEAEPAAFGLAAGSPDVSGLAAIRGISTASLRSNSRFADDGSSLYTAASRTPTADGNALLSVAWELESGGTLIYRELDTEMDGVKSMALLFDQEDPVTGELLVTAASTDGEPVDLTGAAGGAGPHYGRCPGQCYQIRRQTANPCRLLVGVNPQCLAGCCGLCFGACRLGPWVCLGCVFVWCPWCVYNSPGCASFRDACCVC
jgi:hypothetical protein